MPALLAGEPVGKSCGGLRGLVGTSDGSLEAVETFEAEAGASTARLAPQERVQQ